MALHVSTASMIRRGRRKGLTPARGCHWSILNLKHELGASAPGPASGLLHLGFGKEPEPVTFKLTTVDALIIEVDPDLVRHGGFIIDDPTRQACLSHH